VNPGWTLRTGRLMLTPIGGADLPAFRALAGDPRVFAVMLGGVRDAVRAGDDLARFVIAWGRCGYGIWAIHELDAHARFVGVVGLEDRPDGRGTGLRFALWPEAQGRGLAREAAWAALRFGHEQARLSRIVAVARESNFGSRTVLGSIGMHEVESFVQNGYRMLLYESVVAGGRGG